MRGLRQRKNGVCDSYAIDGFVDERNVFGLLALLHMT